MHLRGTADLTAPAQSHASLFTSALHCTVFRRAYNSTHFSTSVAGFSTRHPSPFCRSTAERPSNLLLFSGLELRRSPHEYKSPSALPSPVQSGFTSYTTTVLIALTAGAIVYSVSKVGIGSVKREEEPTSNIPEHILIDEEEIIGDYSRMTGEFLSGRPGTLTPEQDEKLREFWARVLEVFGVLDPKEVNGNGHTEPGRVRSDTVDSKKPKKKRISLFRRKDSDEIDSTWNGHHASRSADADDKYGQTKEFHEALANQSPESLRATFWSMVKHDHPDALLLRFLRARKWDVEKALVMMVSTMRWRSTEMHVDDDIMKKGELAALEAANGSDSTKKKFGEDFLTQMRMGKSFLHGLDKSGRPMCFVRVRLHKQGEQSEESLERYTVFVIESARMILAPPVDTAVGSMTTPSQTKSNIISALFLI